MNEKERNKIIKQRWKTFNDDQKLRWSINEKKRIDIAKTKLKAKQQQKE